MTPVRDSRKRGATGLDPRKAGIGPRGYTIDGHIYGDGNPLAGATVTLYLSSNDSLVSQTTSDGSGYYSFSVVGNTTHYYVTAQKSGYTSAESVHTVVGGNTVDLTLVAQAIIAPQPATTAGGFAAEPQEERDYRHADEEEILLIVAAYLAHRKRVA